MADSYDAWLNQIATQYASNTAVNGDTANASIYGYNASGPQATTNNPEAIAQLEQQFGNSDTLHGLYNSGATAAQVTGTTDASAQINKDFQTLQQLNAWGESDNHAGQDMPPELQAAIASGSFTQGSGSSWSLSATSAGQQQADKLKTQGLADYSLTGSSNYKDPGKFALDNQTQSLVTSASNIDPGSKWAEMAYFGIPTLIAGGAFGAALSAVGGGLGASALMKIPQLLFSATNMFDPDKLPSPTTAPAAATNTSSSSTSGSTISPLVNFLVSLIGKGGGHG